ncbi:MAG: hypothetical protein NC307_07825 [Roseburia sp.]|nr:hypothetical protein [Roseburia sp.]
MPYEVRTLLDTYGTERTQEIPGEIYGILFVREATWYMGWIYPGYEVVDDKLPEKTLLQRKLKKYLLEGKKFGIAKGHVRAF